MDAATYDLLRAEWAWRAEHASQTEAAVQAAADTLELDLSEEADTHHIWDEN